MSEDGNWEDQQHQQDQEHQEPPEQILYEPDQAEGGEPQVDSESEEPKEFVPEQDHDVHEDEVAPEDEGRERDKERAHSMALASGAIRSTAAYQRSEYKNALNTSNEASERYLSILDADRPSAFRPKRRVKLEEEYRNKVHKARRNEADAHNHFDKIEDEHAFVAELVLPEADKDMLTDHEGRQQALDNRAHLLEEWGGVLHDNPVSEAYKEAHPGVDFSAESMVRLKLDVVKAQQEIQELDHLSKTDAVDRVTLFGGSKEKALALVDILGNADKETTEKWDAARLAIVQSRMNANKLYQDIMEAAKKPIQNRMAILEGILDDVVSGNASEQPPVVLEQHQDNGDQSQENPEQNGDQNQG